MKPVMDIHQVMQYIPHRYPFLLIDRVVEMELGKSLTALKNISINESYFQGHFPGRPVMPCVLILEALAQAAGVLAYKSTNTSPKDGVLYFFGGVDQARFKRVVEPGDQLKLEVKVLGSKLNVWKLERRATVGDELACTATFLSARKEGMNRE